MQTGGWNMVKAGLITGFKIKLEEIPGADELFAEIMVVCILRRFSKS